MLIDYVILGAMAFGVWRLFRWRKKSGVVPPTRFVNEGRLYQSIKERYPKAEAQKRFVWLGKQSLDVYIPSKKIAIEYQGEQHYRPVAAFGGKEAFKRQEELDLRKKRLCREHGIRLLYVSFNPKAPARLHGKKMYKDIDSLMRRLRRSWLY